MRDCTRHAFTDGECVTHGCWNCPGRAERAARSPARASVSNGQTALLMASVILFALMCLGAAVVEMPGRWEATRIAHVQQ